MKRKLTDFEIDICEYLEDLRDSGVTNMFWAWMYIQEEYDDISRKEAHNVLALWMDIFEEWVKYKEVETDRDLIFNQ